MLERRSDPERAPTPVELLTDQFYSWERRGRGWQLWPYSVPLEPPFRPFLGHYLSLKPGPIDDARRPTLLSTLTERLLGRGRVSKRPHWEEATLDEEPEPELLEDDGDLVELAVSVPREQAVGRDAAEGLLLAMGSSAYPVSFEVVGTAEALAVQLACRERDSSLLREQVRAFFPDAAVNEAPAGLPERWHERRGQAVVVEFGLSREFMLPLRTFARLDPDPLIPLAGALSGLEEGDLGLLQILFEQTHLGWAESVMRAVTDGEGGAFFTDAPEMVKHAREKVARPLFAVVLRVAAMSGYGDRAWEIVRAVAGALAQFGSPAGNELIPLAQDGDVDLEDDLLGRRTHRSGMLLSSEELLSFVHLPSASVRSEKLTREVKRTKAAPAFVAGRGLVLGENTHHGKTVTVSLRPEERVRHTYVIGASGTGKSSLLLNLILQDLRGGAGLAVLDPHGDLVDQVLGHVPEGREGDVVLLDPADDAFPVGLNILSAHSELEKNLMASDLVAVFRRLSTTWGDQMTSVLGNAVLAFLESERGGTLLDLRRFLIEPDFRREFLTSVRDPEVVYFWQKEFPLLAGKPQGPILTRLDTFLRPKVIRYMVAQKENRLDLAGVMNEGKIFLAKLAQGAIGEENAYLLGTLLVSKLQQLAMARQEVEASKRRPFYLYIDEFHNFVTPSMAAILSGARKYNLGLVLAHQDLRQLGGQDELLGAVIANPYTRICFRVGDFDARKLEDGFSSFGAKDLQNLGTGEAICRVERAEYDFNLKTPPLQEVDEAVSRVKRERLTALSREKYGTPREEVEAALRAAAPPPPAPAPEPEIREPAKRREAEPKPLAAARPPEVERPVAPPVPAVPPRLAPTPGRGGPQHKYLQEIIKRWAESRGYRATIEKEILSGAGSVDVALEREGFSLACEITVTTSVEHETANIQKCLAAGFDQVAVVSLDKKALQKIREAVLQTFDERDRGRVLFFAPEELFSFLEERQVPPGAEETVGGYKVKVSYRQVGEGEKKSRSRAISEVILKGLRKLRKE